MTTGEVITACDLRYSQFAALVFSGMNQRQAYLQIFPPSASDNATDVAASQFIRTHQVQAELKRLKETRDACVMASIDDRRRKLAEFINTPLPKESITPAHVLQAIEINNKMDKLYQDTKNEVNFGSIKILLVEGNGQSLENAPQMSQNAIETSGEYPAITSPLSCPSQEVSTTETLDNGNPEAK